MMQEVAKTLTGLINEMKKMGVTCFPASDLAMALPAYIWDLEQAKPFDYSKPTKKGVNPKVNYTPNDQAMAILASLAYKDGAKGEIKDLLFNGSSTYSLIGKNAGKELAAKGVTLSEASYAQLSSYTSDKGKPCWFSVADETKKVVYIVIRGTQDPADVLSDLNIQTKDVDICGHAAKVHSGSCAKQYATALSSQLTLPIRNRRLCAVRDRGVQDAHRPIFEQGLQPGVHRPLPRRRHGGACSCALAQRGRRRLQRCNRSDLRLSRRHRCQKW